MISDHKVGLTLVSECICIPEWTTGWRSDSLHTQCGLSHKLSRGKKVLLLHWDILRGLLCKNCDSGPSLAASTLTFLCMVCDERRAGNAMRQKLVLMLWFTDYFSDSHKQAFAIGTDGGKQRDWKSFFEPLRRTEAVKEREANNIKYKKCYIVASFECRTYYLF